MATLFIDLADDYSIQFRRGADIAKDEWFALCVWWGNSEALAKGEFKVSIFDFLQKRNWLSQNWIKKGNELKYPVELTNRLNVIGGTVSAFDTLSSQVLSADGDLVTEGELKRPLKPRQKANILRLLQMPNGANFSVPGSGKTAMELVLYRELRAKGDVDRILVIAPRSAWSAWQSEGFLLYDDFSAIEVFDGNLPLGVTGLITNYEQLENDQKLNTLKTFVNSSRTLVVVDEAHRIKGGPNSVRWRAISALVGGAKRVDVLTGTPMPQGYEDLRNLFGITWPSLPKTFLTDVKINSMVRDTVYVRTTKDELELPPVTPVTVVKPMGELQGTIYSALARRYNGLFKVQVATQDLLAKRGKAVMTLIACATNPALLLRNDTFGENFDFEWPPREITEDFELQDVLQQYPLHEVPWKFKWVANFLGEMSSQGKKVLLWSNFVGNIDALQRLLAPFSPAVVHGSVSPTDRELQIDRFRHDPECKVLITNPQTLGEGISLHDVCHTAVYLDRSYNAGQYLQSIDRIHRLGLSPETETNVFFLESSGSIDLRIEARVAVKINAMARFLNDPGLVETSIPYPIDEEMDQVLGAFENTDLDQLFRHLNDET